MQYPAPGSPSLARRVQQLLAPVDVKLDHFLGPRSRHVVRAAHVYPAADIPVVQLSIDETKPASFHFEIAKKLAPLRDEGVLIVGSGNLVHNLRRLCLGPPLTREPTTGRYASKHSPRDLMLSGDYDPSSLRHARIGRCSRSRRRTLPTAALHSGLPAA